LLHNYCCTEEAEKIFTEAFEHEAKINPRLTKASLTKSPKPYITIPIEVVLMDKNIQMQNKAQIRQLILEKESQLEKAIENEPSLVYALASGDLELTEFLLKKLGSK
jgi:hypothetical protein